MCLALRVAGSVIRWLFPTIVVSPSERVSGREIEKGRDRGEGQSI